VNRGAIHGVSKDKKTLRYLWSWQQRIIHEAKIGIIKTDSSQLHIDAPLDKEKTSMLTSRISCRQTIMFI
jgi:hypothetical protein